MLLHFITFYAKITALFSMIPKVKGPITEVSFWQSEVINQ